MTDETNKIMNALGVPQNVQDELRQDHKPSWIDMVIEKQKSDSQCLLRMVGERIRNDLQQILTENELKSFLMNNPWIRGDLDLPNM